KNIVVGMEVDHVGSTSGWTKGKIVQTCYDSKRKDHKVVLLCQDKAKYTTNGGGTSGSPVFEELNPADYPEVANPVALVGIHRASYHRDQADGYSAFSPIKGVLKDFKGLSGLTIGVKESNSISD